VEVGGRTEEILEDRNDRPVLSVGIKYFFALGLQLKKGTKEEK
jgi:hypothetical protein